MHQSMDLVSLTALPKKHSRQRPKRRLLLLGIGLTPVNPRNGSRASGSPIQFSMPFGTDSLHQVFSRIILINSHFAGLLRLRGMGGMYLKFAYFPVKHHPGTKIPFKHQKKIFMQRVPAPLVVLKLQTTRKPILASPFRQTHTSPAPPLAPPHWLPPLAVVNG